MLYVLIITIAMANGGLSTITDGPMTLKTCEAKAAEARYRFQLYPRDTVKIECVKR